VRRNGRVAICGNSYGVMPIFSGELTPGGVYNEGLQVTVTTRAIEDAQRLFNEGYLPFICKTFGITDWIIRLRSPEVRDEVKELQKQSQKVSIAQQMASMGFSVEMTHEGEFKFSKKPVTSPMGGMIGGGMEEPRERTVPLQGEPMHTHPATEGRLQGEPEMRGIFTRAIDKVVPEGKTIHAGKYGEHYYISDEFKKKDNDMLVETIGAEQSLIKGIEKVEKKLGRNFAITKQSLLEQIIYALGDIFKLKFAKLTKTESETAKKILIDGMRKNKTLFSIQQDIAKVSSIETKISPEEIERIVRTESAILQLKGKELAYKEYEKEEGEQLYKWSPAYDDRMCKACNEVGVRTAKGVPLEELKKIVKETTKKYYPLLTPRDFIVHPQCRCSYDMIVQL